MVDIRKAWLLFWRDKLRSNEMNSFKLLSVKIYNIKELLVLSLVSLKQKIYTTKKAEVRNTLKSIRDQNIHQSWLINTNNFHFMAMRWYLYKGISWTQMNEAISFKNSTWRQNWSKYISDCAFFFSKRM